MDIDYELTYHKLEEKYWWFKSRRNSIISILNKMNLPKTSKVLEIGCSGGPLLQILNEKGYINSIGIDISENAIKVCNKRGVFNSKVMDATNLTFKNESFDIVIASDILEHIENDTLALSEWCRVLKPGGKLVIYVPAYMKLWSHHDEINHHFRRYQRSDLKTLLSKNNFLIKKISYWNFFLFFPTLIIRKITQNKKKNIKINSQLYAINPIVNFFLKTLLHIENWLLKYIEFPFGVSVFAICEKPQDKKTS